MKKHYKYRLGMHELHFQSTDLAENQTGNKTIDYLAANIHQLGFSITTYSMILLGGDNTEIGL